MADYVLDITTKPGADGETVLARIESRGKPTGEYVVARQTDRGGKRVKNERCIVMGNDEKLVPVLSRGGLKRVLLAGSTGCGKSMLAAKMLEQCPHEIVAFSRLAEDPSIDDHVKVTRIPLDALTDTDIDMTDLAGKVLLADDWETYRDKKVVKKIQELVDSCLETGRHEGVSFVLRTTHHLLNGKVTRQALLESNGIALFPHSGGVKHGRDFMKSRLGISGMVANRMMKTPSRWIVMYMDTPNTAIFEDHIELL